MKDLTRKKYIIFLLTIVCIMTIGFAVLSTTLTINGTSTINSNSWDVKFQNLQVDSATNVGPTTYPSITDNTSINFAVALSKPGETFSFTVDVLNSGSIDAMINTINKSTLTTAQEKYLDYTVTYSDGGIISQKDKLNKNNGKESINISVKYKVNVELEDLPSTEDYINLSFSLQYVQADNTALTRDLLAVFIAKAKAGNAIASDVGREFIVDMGILGEHTLRVSNVSVPTECSNAGFSQTACGVVLEFKDIIITRNYHTTETCEGGWKNSDIRSYVNDDIYNSLPELIKTSIISTTVESDSTWFDTEASYTNDKMYLLSSHEVWESDTLNQITNDNTWDYTRQLDYYSKENVTISQNYDKAIKKNNNTNTSWWLRNFNNDFANVIYQVHINGMDSMDLPNSNGGVSPAFRIA